jgi:hypothetical protein
VDDRLTTTGYSAFTLPLLTGWPRSRHNLNPGPWSVFRYLSDDGCFAILQVKPEKRIWRLISSNTTNGVLAHIREDLKGTAGVVLKTGYGLN